MHELGIEYAVGGSMASSVFGEPRSTADIDVLVALQPRHASHLARALEREFYVSEESLREAIARRSSFNAIHLDTMIKVDVFVASADVLDTEQMRRRRTVNLSQTSESEVDVTAPENIVLRKLAWYRASGGVSDRQWRDVQGVLKQQGRSLDVDYLRDIAAQTELGVLLDRALREAGLAADG
ncbi:hypothetical protein [Haliangium sp.]